MTWAMPAGAADNGTVTGTVTVTPAADAACITVGATLVDWGPLPFGGSAVAPNPGYEITNCSTVSEYIYVSGTDASGDLGAAWTLGAAPDTNVFAVNAALAGLGAEQISTSNTLVVDVGPGTASTVDHELFMPVAGSSGGDGEAMTFDITWTAVAGSADPCADGCISYDGPVNSAITVPGEVQVYEYTHSGGTLTADLVFSHVDGDLDMQLRDAAGNLLGAGFSTTDNETISVILDAGTYYVDVFGFEGATNVYNLTITSGP